VLRGLVRRRAAEAALFLKEDATEPSMPQLVDAPSEQPSGSRKLKAANTGEATMVASSVGIAGLTLSDSFGYAQQAASFIREYGVEMAIGFAFIGSVAFALIKHFTREDHAEGRYVPSGEAQ
jgi:hypothetical protein